MKNRTLRPLKTADGSFTLLYEELNEHYHSLDGARGESEYVYVANGLDKISKETDTVNVFEIGIGTGLNVLLSVLWSDLENKKVEYLGLEPFPINSDTIRFINANSGFHPHESKIFTRIHESNSRLGINLSDKFSFKYVEQRLEEFETGPFLNTMHLVFFDAFAPSRQEEIWSVGNLIKCYEMLQSGGILTTYCASGLFKRNLKSAGFKVSAEKGFGKKREMFLGIKP